MSPAPGEVGVAVVGDGINESTTWSGSPAGLIDGLRQLGVRVEVIDAAIPRPLALAGRGWRQARRRGGGRGTGTHGDVWERSPEAIQLRQWWARRASRRVDPAAWVQIGSELGNPLAPGSFVTFDDMTVIQARQLPNPYFARIDEPSFAFWESCQRRLFHSARAVCVASAWAGRSVVSDYGVPAEQVHVVGIGANLELEPGSRDWSRPRYLFVGLDWQRKNGPAVVRAFSIIHAENPESRLDLVGDHPPVDGAGIFGHGRLDRSTSDGRDRLAALFRSSTCLVVPSLSEPFGIVYLEAASAGTASIGTLVGGASEPIGETGILVDPRDELSLLEAMRRMSQPTEASARGAAAAERARLFTWKRVAARTLRAADLVVTDPPEAFLSAP